MTRDLRSGRILCTRCGYDEPVADRVMLESASSGRFYYDSWCAVCRQKYQRKYQHNRRVARAAVRRWLGQTEDSSMA